MGFVVSSYGMQRLLNKVVQTGDTDLRAAVILSGGTMTDAQIEDAQFVSNIIGQNGEVEASNSGYARPTLTSVTVAADTTNNRVNVTATVPTMNNVAAGGTWRRVLYYWHTGADSANYVLGVDTPAATLTPNGGNITCPPLDLRINDTSA